MWQVDSDGVIYGYYCHVAGSCGWYRYSKIIPITAKLITGGFALRTSATSATTMRTTLTRMVSSAATMCIGMIPAGILSENRYRRQCVRCKLEWQRRRLRPQCTFGFRRSSPYSTWSDNGACYVHGDGTVDSNDAWLNSCGVYFFRYFYREIIEFSSSSPERREFSLL